MTYIERAALELAAFAGAITISWYVGSIAVWRIWCAIAKHYDTLSNEASPLASVVGGLERSLYIFSVMADKYELIAGWLVMKSFFGWIQARRNRPTENGVKLRSASDVLGTYNGFLILNLLSLFVGLSCGMTANFLIAVLSSNSN